MLPEHLAAKIAAILEESGQFSFVDWDGLGEIDVHDSNQAFRVVVEPVVDEDSASESAQP